MLVDTAWLHQRLDDPGLVVVDMRWREDGTARGRYEAGHIPGAVYLDWATDLVEPGHRVAFMLAGPKRFGEAMARCGIGDHTVVVAYSDGFGSGPHRLWWASRVYGHDTVRVLDGGFEKWVREDRPISTEQPAPRPPAPAWRARPPDQRLIATVEDVERAGEGDDVVLLDARRPEQFRGEAVWYETGAIQAGPDGIARTPRGDIRAGRIPWAVSLPWSDLYRDDRTMKSPAELRQALARAGVREPRKAITYCGVGISASALLFALTLAGVEHAALYDGSWEEWGRDPARPLARG